MESLGKPVLSASVPRALRIDVNNESKHTFYVEGAWFSNGGWASSDTECGPDAMAAAGYPKVIGSGGEAQLQMQAEDSLGGVRGAVWYVTADRTAYLSIVFCSRQWWPCSYFDAWAGPPPRDLIECLSSAAALCDTVHPHRGVRWHVGEDSTWGLTVVSLSVLAGLPEHVDAPDFSEIPQDCYLGFAGADDGDASPNGQRLRTASSSSTTFDDEQAGSTTYTSETPSASPTVASTAAPSSQSTTECYAPVPVLRVEPGAKVRITGLKKASVASLNGKTGQVLHRAASSTSPVDAHQQDPGTPRWHVQVDGGDNSVKSIKEPNLVPLSPTASSSRTPPPFARELSRQQKQRREARLAEEEVMDASRPPDILSAAITCTGDLLCGFALSLATIVTFPFVGVRVCGPLGCVCGLVVSGFASLGIAAGVIMQVAVQLLRGAFNTPAAIFYGCVRSKKWHPGRGRWVDDRCNLADMERVVQDMPSDSELDEEGDTMSRSGKVKETALYEILCTSPKASDKEIKKAYYKEALRWHPDKNRGDDKATKRFQQIQDAYQVLSNPELRERYDRQGEAGVAGKVPKINPVLFFSILFGSEKFEAYTGRMDLAATLERVMKGVEKGQQGMTDMSGFAQDAKEGRRSRRKQLKRVVKCAVLLRGRLDSYVQKRSESKFIAESQAEAAELAQTSFGPHLLAGIGWVYVNRANNFLDTIDSSEHFYTETKVRKNCRGLYLNAKLVSSLPRLLWAAKCLMDKAPSQDGDEAAQRRAARLLEEEMMKHVPVFLKAMWEWCALDIERTTRDVCRKLLKDVSVPWIIRYRRAVALRQLGMIFQSVGEQAMEAAPNQSESVLTEEAINNFRRAAAGSVNP